MTYAWCPHEGAGPQAVELLFDGGDVALSELRVKQLLQRYVDHINAGEVDKLIALFAEDAEIEDPIGSGPRRGHEELRIFYQAALSRGVQIVVEGPIRGSQSNTAAMAFRVNLPSATVSAIEMMTFRDDEKIARMVACFGPMDISRY